MKKINTFLRCCCMLAFFAAFSSSINAQCSIDIVGQTATPVCNDNGTPFDITDDFITIELQVTGTDTGANGYSVCVVGGAPLTGTGSYGMASTFDLPAGSAGAGNVNIEVKDTDDNTCILTPAATIVDPGTCSPFDIAITDPCNCTLGVDCDGDFVNEFVSETVTITGPAGFNWSFDAANADAANILADACAGTTIADGTAMVETSAGVYEFTFLKPVGTAVNTAFVTDTGLMGGILTSACPACPSNCPTVALDAPDVCDGSDIVMTQLNCTDFAGFPDFVYDLYLYNDGTFDAPAGYVPTVTPTSFPADDANLTLVNLDFDCTGAPTVSIAGVTICDIQELTFFALPFDYSTFEYVDVQCGFSTVTSTVYPNYTIGNIVEACDGVSADLLGTDGSVCFSVVDQACVPTPGMTTIDFTADVTTLFDPALAPADCLNLTFEGTCAPLNAPTVPDKVVHCAGKAFGGITASCDACIAPGQTGQTNVAGAGFAFAGGGVITQDIANIAGIPAGAIIDDISVTVAMDDGTVGGVVMGMIAPNGAIISLISQPNGPGSPNTGNLNSAFPITFNDGAATSSYAMGNGLADTEDVCGTDGICDYTPSDESGTFGFNMGFFMANFPTAFYTPNLNFTDAAASAGATANGDWLIFATDFNTGGTVASWDITIDWFLPAEAINWYDEAGNIVGTGETFFPSEADLNTPGTYNYSVECVCGTCISPLAPVALTVVDCSCDDGCTYLLVLEDTEGNGWDAASIDVSIDEASTTNYKMTVADGTCKVIPICIGDGGTIDLTYWNGANELEHAVTLLDPLGNVANDNTGTAVDYDGNIPVNQTMRVKSECPFASCTGETEDFTIRITMGGFPEEQSWEVYDGPASTTIQGNQVFGVNATTYTGLAPGFQVDYDVTLNKCGTYTFVAFDGFNDGWNSPNANWELIADNINYGVEITNPNDSHFGDALVLSLNNNGDPNFTDEDRVEFTIPCEGSCTDVNVTDASAATCATTAQVVLPVATPEICYPNCNHALGCDIQVQHTLLVDGIDYAAISGSVVDYTGQVTMDFDAIVLNVDLDGDGAADPGVLPVGCHKYVTSYTYCDGVIAKCTADLNIVTDPNPVMTCNDNVIVSLAVPTSPAGGTTLGECIVRVSPDMVLEGPASECFGVFEEYTVTVLDANGNPIIQLGPNGLPLDAFGSEILPGQNTQPANDLIGPAQEWQTITYVVEHKFSGNKCWGTISVEDKSDPILVATNYEVNCTHPEALNENWTHTDTYAVTDELPANIAGGTGGLQSNTFIPVNMPCGPMGEIIQDIRVNLNLTHNDVTDLSVMLHVPADLDAWLLANVIGYTGSPIQLDQTGNVGPNNVYVPNPINDAPALLNLIGAPCMLTESTVPETFITENSGANVPSNVGNTWYIQVIDNNATFPTPPFGGGEITAASITLTCGFPFPYGAYDCNLEGVELLSEMVMETNCDQSEWLGSKIVRVWQATDKAGRTSTAEQIVGLKAPTMDQIEKPGDIHVQCTEEEPAYYTPEVAGIPTFGCFDLTTDLHGLCDISYSYEDQVLPTCGEGYKIIRTWTILNWCSTVAKTHEQLIKVEDTEGPTVTQEDITATADAYDCSTDVTLEVGSDDNCSGISTITASYQAGGSTYLGNSTLVVVDITNGGTLTDLPVGATTVYISAKDGCLNTTLDTVLITVVDEAVPVAICDDELHVSLGGDGSARLNAEDIDEGSYDNCGDITLEVRRTDGCLGQSAWAEYVSFECCDRDELVTVELRVTDEAGNTNTCWKQVLVEDALAPVITAPADYTITCNDDMENLFGEPDYQDNCTATIEFTDSGELDQCKAGTLTRNWVVMDGSTKSSNCVSYKRVTVQHVSDFIVQFPSDVTINNCTTPENTGEPTLSNVDCELIGMTHDDVVLSIAANACYQIERTWTIVNNCTVDFGNPSNTDLGIPQPLPRTYQDDDGYFTYVQIISVLDSEAPVIETCPDNLVFCDLTDGCEGQADLTITATDGCSDDSSLEYAYQIDANNDGSFDISSTGNDATGIYPYGTHRIKWVVEDGCGNTSACEYLFTIEDCKNPTPVCLNGVTIENMQTGCVDIWASDMLEYAFDNCTDSDFVEGSVKMRREGDTAAPTSAMTLCCEDLGTVIVEVWVEDEAGNADYCTTYIVLQDNLGNCPSSDENVSVAGTITTEAGDNVENVMVEVDGGMTAEMPTTENGTFAFNAPMNGNYTITPAQDENPLNGVSTFDLVLMSQHILGLSEFTTPYQMIAGDVNNDGNITTFDIVQTRQLILYVITDFPANTSWRFVDADYVFPVATNPWMEAFPEVINYSNLTNDELASDFVGVKIGDVNGDATANSLLGADDRNMDGAMIMNIDDATINAGETVTVDFRANDFNGINGFQYTMNVEGLTFAGVEAGAINVTEGNFGLTMMNEGVITTSWNTSEAVNVRDEEVLFSMTFVAATATELSEAISISSRYTAAEAYASTDLLDVAIAFNGTEVATANNFKLYQNTPNPFNGETVIGFDLPEAATATLKVYDVSGKVLKLVNGDYTKGYNQISLNSNDLNASGVLYYQLDTPANSATMKMIILE